MSWDPAQGEWVGPDVVDFEPTKPPDYQPDWSKHPTGMDALGGDCPFIMIADGKASLFTPSGLKDAPCRRITSRSNRRSRTRSIASRATPSPRSGSGRTTACTRPADPRFPYALTTYRLTEHHAGGIPTRSVPVTAELQPEAFAEISPGARRGARHPQSRLGHALDLARRGRSQGAGHRPPAALRGSTAKRSIRSASSGISAGRALPPAISPIC